MPSWSVDGQDPAFLAASRMVTLAPRVIADILEELHLEPGMKVLDVGCGSGEYVFRLGTQVSGVSFTGVDYDPGFVDFAQKRAKGGMGEPYAPISPDNTYEFVQGDGLCLPFPAESFDAVISHTYLTAVPDYMVALAEMCRVCKAGGWVSSVTVMSSDFGGVGRMQLLGPMVGPENAELVNRVCELAAGQASRFALTEGIAPRKVPVSFAWIGLDDVTVRPLAQYFCLSDSATSTQDYHRYVELLYRTEVNAAHRLRAQVPQDSLSDDEWRRYGEVLRRRRDQLLDSIGHNIEWDWFGSASLLVRGCVPQGGMFENVETLHDQQKIATPWRDRALNKTADLHERYQQLGPGRAVQMDLVDDSGTVVAKGRGLFPAQAAAVAYASYLGEFAELGVLSISQVPAEEAAKLPRLSDAVAFSVELLWETVSEAAQAGESIALYGEKEADAYICCCVRSGQEGMFASRIATTQEELGIQLACAYVLGDK